MLETNATIYVPDYPLSTNKYSGAKDSISLLLKIYKLMLDGCNSSNITIMGDSAGASLTLILGQQVKLHKLPAPKNLIALSPVLSLNIDESKSVEMGKHDSVLSAGLFYVARE
jgi:acetyl esterase/lipase